jgi:glycerol kinase
VGEEVMATSNDPSRPELQETTEGNIPKQDEEKLKNWFIGSVDQGTTSTRFLIFDGLGTPVASHQIEFKQLYPHPGWVVMEKTTDVTDDEH